MDCIYIALLSKALYSLCLTFTHSHTVGRGNHAGLQPAQREQLELGVLLKDTTTDLFPRRSWTQTTNLSVAGRGLYHLSHCRPLAIIHKPIHVISHRHLTEGTRASEAGLILQRSKVQPWRSIWDTVTTRPLQFILLKRGMNMMVGWSLSPGNT